MSFFHNDVKAKPRPSASSKVKLKDIPISVIESMAEAGCKICPLDDSAPRGASKLEPVGRENAEVYLLFSAPTESDGFPEVGDRARDKGMKAVLDKFPPRADVRVGGMVQCATGTVEVGARESACCKGRVIEDIERTRPRVIIGVGDAVLAWATGFKAYAPTWRGRYITVKFGNHVCLFYSVCYPNWAFKKNQFGKSEHELTLEHDIRKVFEDLKHGDTPERTFYEDGFSDGVEIITGTGPDDMRRLEHALSDLAAVKRVGCDIETNGLRPWGPDPRIWTCAVGTFERTIAFPLDHPAGWGSDVQRRRVWSMLGEWIIHSGIKECHNLAMELEWFGFFYGARAIRLTEWDDTMSMAHTLDARPGTKSLNDMVRAEFGFFLKPLSNIDASRIVEYPIKKVLTYNAMDAKWTNAVARKYRPILAQDEKLQAVHDRKVRLASTLVLTEARGMPVDFQHALDIEEKMEALIVETRSKIARCPEVLQYEKRFGRFSPTNPDHVLVLMDKVCQRPEVRSKEKDGSERMSSDKDALSLIPRSEVPSAALILEDRGIEKLLSTYVRPVTSRQIISFDGKIHGKYSSMTAVTNRLACEDPNLQNWPKRKHKEVRGIISSKLRRWLLACDYGQIEFRVVGMCSEDPNLVKYCWTGYDVHMFWAERMAKKYPKIKDWIVSEFEVDWDEKGIKTLRQEAKNKWVFPQLFGSSTRSCAANLHLPEDVADSLGKEFWDEFPQVKRWQQRLLKSYEQNLYVETLGGFRRRGPMSPNEVINMPIQGTAAEIVTEGMMALSELSTLEEDDDIHPVLNVHDDITSDVPDEKLEMMIDTTVRELCMHRFDYINVPLVVEVSMAKRWSELEEIGVYRSDEIFNLRNPYK